MQETVVIEQLKQYVNRVAKLRQEISDLNDDVKQVFDEAKANGFDIVALKQVIKIMNTDKNKLATQEAMIDLYREALGV